MPFLCLVLLFGVLGLDVVQLLTLELVLILRFLGGARDARREGPEDGGGVLRGNGRSAHRCDAWEDIFAVEACAPVRELAVVGGEREPRLGHISLVHAKAPEREELDMSVNIALVEFLLSVVHVDVSLPGRHSGEDERKGGEGVRCKDRIVKERSWDEARERLKVNEAAAVGRGGGEGCKVVSRGAAHDVLDGGDDHLGRTEGCDVVHNNGDGGRANSDEAAHFVGGVEEGAAEIVGVVEYGDSLFLFAARRKQ